MTGTQVRTTFAGAVLLLLGTSAPVAAQAGGARVGSAPRLEIAAFGGLSAGLASLTDALAGSAAAGLRLGGLRNVETDPGSSLRWLLGGGVGFAVAPRLSVTGEVLMNRIANPRFTGTVGRDVIDMTTRITLSEYTAGVHYALTSGRSAPYVGMAIGLVRFSARIGASALPGDISVAESDMTMNFGGGIRLHAGPSWGIRPDFKVVRVPDKTFYRTSVGVFYQIR